MKNNNNNSVSSIQDLHYVRPDGSDMTAYVVEIVNSGLDFTINYELSHEFWESSLQSRVVNEIEVEGIKVFSEEFNRQLPIRAIAKMKENALSFI